MTDDDVLAVLARVCGGRAVAAAEVAELERLLRAAVAHGVTPLVAGRLLEGVAGELAPATREGLEIFRDGERIRAEALAAQLAAVLAALAAAGVTAMPFKGPVLARDLYGDAALRGSRDLDFLVPEGEVEAALGCLLGLGYRHEDGLGPAGLAALRGYAGEYILFHDSAVPAEPHWLVAPRTLAFELDMAAIWRRSRAGHFEGAACRLLDPGDNLLLLALHGGKEQWAQLKWVADIAAFIARHPQLDWDGLRARAAAQGCRRMLELAVLLAVRLFGVAMPAGMAPDAVVRGLAGLLMGRMARGEAPEGLPYVVDKVYWRMRERWRDRLAYVGRTVLTPRVAHVVRLPLPAWLAWLRVPLKLPWDYALTPALQGWRRRRHAAGSDSNG